MGAIPKPSRGLNGKWNRVGGGVEGGREARPQAEPMRN